MCPKLKEEDTTELRANINSLLRKAQVPKPNLTRQEMLGLAQLKKNKDRVILTADKGVAMVVMDREYYITKAETLFSQPAYRLLPRYPTNQIKAKLITERRRIKKNNNLEEGMYKAMYPTGCVPHKFYGLPKIHKTGNPLRPIVSSRGSVTYGVAKVLNKVLQPLLGKSPHHIQSASDFVNRVKGLTLQLEECHILWCCITFHFSPNRSSPKHYQRSIGKGWKVKWQNSIISTGHYWTLGVLSA